MDNDNLIIYDYEQKTSYKSLLFRKSFDFYSIEQLKKTVDEYISVIPRSILFMFQKYGWHIILTNRRNLEQEYGYDYEIYGLTDYDRQQIIIYAKDESAIQQSLYHEFGHFLDYLLDLSGEKDWFDIWNEEKEYYDSAIFTQADNPAENFADAFLWYLTCTRSNRLIQTEKLFRNITENLDYILVLPEIEENYQKKRNAIRTDKELSWQDCLPNELIS